MADVRFGSLADIPARKRDVCFTSKADTEAMQTDVRFGPKAAGPASGRPGGSHTAFTVGISKVAFI